MNNRMFYAQREEMISFWKYIDWYLLDLAVEKV